MDSLEARKDISPGKQIQSTLFEGKSRREVSKPIGNVKYDPETDSLRINVLNEEYCR